MVVSEGMASSLCYSRGIAEILAFMDSAFLAEDEDVLADARIICRRAIEAMQAEQERYSALVESTRVNFGLMVEG